jgi:uncharacterized protein (DUF488 family)
LSESHTVFTVGHGTRTIAELAGVLQRAGVGRLVDVRRWPRSRRNPHLDAQSLAAALPSFSIEYDWRGEALGGRRSPAPSTRHGAWRKESFRAYADYMDTELFRVAFIELEGDARLSPALAIMCAETLWWHCHRRLIADALALRGHAVVHLVDEKNRYVHPLHDSVRADADGWPVYDVGVADELPFGSDE